MIKKYRDILYRLNRYKQSKRFLKAIKKLDKLRALESELQEAKNDTQQN